MDLIKVDHIDIQPAQTVFAFAPNGFRLQVVMDISLFIPAKAAFRENVRPGSRPGFQRNGDNFLGVAHAVNGGGIDPVNAQLKSPMYCRNGRFVVLVSPAKFPARAANGPGAEADGCEGQIGITEALRFHVRLNLAFVFSVLIGSNRVHRDRMSSINSLLARAIQAIAVCRAIDSR